MPYSANYLGAGGVKIEPNRVDNYSKLNTKAIPKTQKFDEVLKQERISKINKPKQSISTLGVQTPLGSTPNNLNTEQTSQIKNIRQKIDSNLQDREKEHGTDFALKELSCELEQQILGILWNLAFSAMDRQFEGGLGEELFHKELVNEMVKLSKTGEMGAIAQSIYDDLKNQANNTDENI
jgi:hypothetical protein